MQAAPAVAERVSSAPRPVAPRPTVPRPSARKSREQKSREWHEWWEERRRKARESSIRRGTYNPGNWPVNPDYEPDREKAMASLEAFRARNPGPHLDSTAFIRRCRDLDLGNNCTEEELEEL